jgi:hypothetical protein
MLAAGPRGEPNPVLLAKIGRIAVRRLGEALDPTGLKPRHIAAMTALRENPSSQMALSEATGVDAAKLVGVLNDLESEGLVTRSNSPSSATRASPASTPRYEPSKTISSPAWMPRNAPTSAPYSPTSPKTQRPALATPRKSRRHSSREQTSDPNATRYPSGTRSPANRRSTR